MVYVLLPLFMCYVVMTVFLLLILLVAIYQYLCGLKAIQLHLIMKNDNKWKLFLRSFKSHLTRNIIIFLALALWFRNSDFWGSLITTVLVNPFASKLHGIY